MTKINLDITATKAARIVQDDSIGETLKAAGLSESSSKYPSIVLSVNLSPFCTSSGFFRELEIYFYMRDVFILFDAR